MLLRLSQTLREHLVTAKRPIFGGWVCTGSPIVAEIMAGSGLDWVLIDMEHAPNGLESVLAQLHAVSAYAATPVVRVPVGDPVIIKQVLDIGAMTILVPMVSTAEEARRAAQSAQYPPVGTRGVGSALARSARWNRIDEYLACGADYVSVLVQIETIEGVENARAIAETPGIDGIFVGPSDLAASMGLLGQQTHPDVIAAVVRAFTGIEAGGKPFGVNVFDPIQADFYASAGASFLLVGADVSLLARGSESLVHRFIASRPDHARVSY